MRHTQGTIRAAGRAAARSAARGLTLVEALVVIAIAAILAAMAVPGFQDTLAGARAEEAEGGLRAAIELARSEALARGERAAVCRSADANAAAPSCSDAATDNYGAADWAVGWIVYRKAAASLDDAFAAGDTLVRRQPALAAEGPSSRVMLWGPAATPTPIVFGANGLRLAGPTGAFAIDHGPALTSRPVALSSPRARCLELNAVGHLRSAPAVSGACP